MPSGKKMDSMPYVLFTYSIDHLAQKDKVLFYYALKGRDGKSGMLADERLLQLGRTVLLVPKAQSKEFSDFLKHWRCKFSHKEVSLDSPGAVLSKQKVI